MLAVGPHHHQPWCALVCPGVLAQLSGRVWWHSELAVSSARWASLRTGGLAGSATVLDSGGLVAANSIPATRLRTRPVAGATVCGYQATASHHSTPPLAAQSAQRPASIEISCEL